MFTIDQIKGLNDLEYSIYLYIEKNKQKVIHQKVKEVADELHVSPSMITRVCKKLSCDGFSELKLKIRMQQERPQEENSRDIGYLLDYFNKINNEESNRPIKEAAKLVCHCKEVLFFGIGLSGALARYGASLFNRNGIKTICIDDFSSRLGIYDKNTCAIILTVSGETREVNDQIMELKRNGVNSIVITNSENTTAAKLADITISYYVPNNQNRYFHNSATQVPVMYIIESLMKTVNRSW